MGLSLPSEVVALSPAERREVGRGMLRGREGPPHLEAAAIALARWLVWLTWIGLALVALGVLVLITAVAASHSTDTFIVTVGVGAFFVAIGLVYLVLGRGPRRVARAEKRAKETDH